jgi:queuine tRNA-ribosyltransferase
MELTQRWAVRSLAARGDSAQALFGIVQGACHPDLRRRSAEQLAALPFDGLAIGGLAVGESKAERDDFTELCTGFLPADRPRYLMGVGTPLDLLEGVHRGVDMFDCILPIALAQRGVVYTTGGRLQLRRGVYKYDERVIDPGCACPTCAGWSRGYFHHLIKAGETLGWALLGLHNLHFYHNLMAAMRRHILEGSFGDYYRKMRVELARDDEDNPPCPTPPPRKPKALRQSQLGDYEVLPDVRGGDFASIRQISSGEVMHSVSDPMEEARRLYVEQAGLAALLAPAAGERALVVWDVGLGAATNAMAGLACWEAVLAAAPQPPRPLRLVSFERDLDPLRLAVRNAARFPHLHHPGPASLLRSGRWEHPAGLEWELREGDFMERRNGAPRPDLVWYDPFSFKTDGPLWQLDTFRRLAAGWREGAADQSDELRLFTYTASTAVRAALLAAGFWVARGEPTGPKSETTIAVLPAPGRRPGAGRDGWPALDLLGPEWLGRWERSSAPWPADLPAGDQADFAGLVRQHPQFA